MLDLMTWQEIVDQLQNEGQFKMAVMFDLKGQIIAGTDGAMIESGEAIVLQKSMDINNNTIYGIFVSGIKFSCLTIDRNSLVGRADDDVFIAHRNNSMLVCAVSSVKTEYSCLGFIKNFLRKLSPNEDKTETLV